MTNGQSHDIIGLSNEREENNMGTKEQRMELLAGMNQYILDLGDEEAYAEWFSLGIPDGATANDYEFIADNLEEWVYICQLFGRLIKEYEETYEE